jgi:hypothetical protein
MDDREPGTCLFGFMCCGLAYWTRPDHSIVIVNEKNRKIIKSDIADILKDIEDKILEDD